MAQTTNNSNMKRIISICLLGLCSYVNGQTWQDDPSWGRSFTRLKANWMVIPRYNDTTAANTAINLSGSLAMPDSCGTMIYTRTDKNVWIRQCSPKKWALMGGGGSSDFSYADTPYTGINKITTQYTIRQILNGSISVAGYNNTNWDEVYTNAGRLPSDQDWVGENSFLSGKLFIKSNTSRMSFEYTESDETAWKFPLSFYNDNKDTVASLGYVRSAIADIPTGGVTSVTGTTNRITSTGGTTPVIDISASYVGQSSITTVGALTSGSLASGFTPVANSLLANSTISGVSLGSNLFSLSAGVGITGFTTYNGSANQTVNVDTNTITTRLRALQIADSIRAAATVNQWNTTGNTITAGSLAGPWIGTFNLASWRIRTNNIQRAIFDSIGNFGVGMTNVPQAKVHTSDGNLISSGLAAASDYFLASGQATVASTLTVASNTSTDRGVFKFVKAGGTLGTPTAPAVNNYVGSFLGTMYDGAAMQGTAELAFLVDGTVSSGVAPQRVSLLTSPTLGTSRLERLTVKSDGQLRVFEAASTAISTGLFATQDKLIMGANASAIGLNLAAAGTGADNRGLFKMVRGRGTLASPTTIVTGDEIGTLTFAPFDGTNAIPTARITGLANGTVTTGSVPTDIVFTAGSVAQTTGVTDERMRIRSNGNVGIGTSSPTALMHIGAGTTTNPSSKFTAGVLTTTIQALAQEADARGFYSSNAGLNRYAEGGKIYGTSTDVSNTGTSETDLVTYTTKASTLGATDESLVFDIAGTLNDATSTAQLQFYFASNLIGNTGALTVSATGGWSARIIIIRSGSATAKAMVTVTTPGASTAQYTSTTSLTGITFTNTNIIKATGTAGGVSGGTGDITASAAQLVWWGSSNN